MSRGNYKLGPNCRALSILALTVSIGLFSEYLLEVRKVNYPRDLFPNEDSLFSLQEFKINVSDQIINGTLLKLQQHLTLTLERRSEYQHSKLLQEIVDYWRNKYDWRQREAYFNKYPNYKTTIHGINLHFVHVDATNTKNPTPIILLHGWPGSFKDFYPLIPYLNNDNFTIVIPSLIGCTFSKNYYVRGIKQAVVFNALMKKLGYEKYYVYGNDWGSFIGTEMAIMFPQNVMGFYTPFCISLRRISLFKYFLESFIPDLIIEKKLKSKYTIRKSLELVWNDNEFINLYSMKSDALGLYLDDSPVALANYIINIIQSITFIDPKMFSHKNITEIFGYDNLIDTFMLYWVTQSATSTVNYLNDIANDYIKSYQIPINAVPVACPKLLNGIFYQSDWILKDKFKYIVSRSTFSAKHFHLLEEDSLYIRAHANDIKNAVTEMMAVKQFSP